MSILIRGLLLTLMTGFFWTGIAVFYSYVARKRLNVYSFCFFATLTVAVQGWVLCDWPVVKSGEIPAAGLFIPAIIIAGICCQTGMLLNMYAMRQGHQSATNSVCQSAMLFPFLGGILLWNDPISVMAIVGLILIMASIVFFSRRVHEETESHSMRRWAIAMLLTFIAYGLTQFLCTMPSHWAGWSDAGRLRIPILNTAGTLALLIFGFRKIRKFRRKETALGLFCGVFMFLGQLCLFASMDLMALAQKVSLVYPLCVIYSIILFAFYTRFLLKEKLGRYGIAGLVFGVLGIYLLGSR